jgi:hypothetical protein
MAMMTIMTKMSSFKITDTPCEVFPKMQLQKIVLYKYVSHIPLPTTLLHYMHQFMRQQPLAR